MASKNTPATKSNTPVTKSTSIVSSYKDADGDIIATTSPEQILIASAEDFLRAVNTVQNASHELVMSLDPGQGIFNATFVREGGRMGVGEEKMVYVNGQATGELKRDEVKTWVLTYKADNGQRLNILLIGKHGINSFLSSRAPGEKVAIFRHAEQKETKGGRRVNQYHTVCLGWDPEFQERPKLGAGA